MLKIYEIRIHGRGGQGVRTTAHILGRAAFLSGFKTQEFAVYGAERRGAPVASFCRISKDDILIRGYIFNPDAVIILDDTINPDIALSGLKKTGLVLVNAEESSPGLCAMRKKFHAIKSIDATKIALDILGKPIPNVAILGGFLKLTKLFPMENLKKAVKIELEEAGHGEAVKGNIRACEVCWERIK